MPELNFAPEPESSPLKSVLIAAVVLIAIAAAVYWFSPHKDAIVTVQQEHVFAPHTETGPLVDGGGFKVLGAASTEDDLYIVADLKIDNKIGMPLFVTSLAGTLTSPSGDQVDATIVTEHDIPKLEDMFSNLTPMLQNPLPLDATVTPKGTLSGSILMLFPNLTEADWKAKKSAILTINLAHQAPLNVPLP